MDNLPVSVDKPPRGTPENAAQPSPTLPASQPAYFRGSPTLPNPPRLPAGTLPASPPPIGGGEGPKGPWQRPGRFLCPLHRYVITTGMPGCPRCIADAQDDPEQESLL